MTTLTRFRSPMSEVQFSQLNRLFDDALRLWPWNGSQESTLTGTWIPPVDVMEDKDQVMIVAEVTGVRPEDVKISLENNLLTIRGEKHQHREQSENERVHRYERAYGEFERAFTVPSTVDAERISARYENGVLTLTLPKVERAKPRQIQVQVQA